MQREAQPQETITMAESLDARSASTYMRILPETECYQLLAVATVGRVGFVSPTGVQILPIDYRLGADHRLFLNTSPDGSVAQLARAAAPVAFEVDYHADDFGLAWSVLINGTLRFLDAEATAAYAELRLRPVPWPGLVDAVTLQFVPECISGRGLHRP
jgi:nitroimidazol reductase NimA-like FMN-containing flavoprotein (pyridoxamine 5'-phosphate oxidase superfamily)